MIDIRILRENPELVKKNAARRGCDVDIDKLSELDKQYLALVREVEELRAERNRLSKECKDNPEAREKVKELKPPWATRRNSRTKSRRRSMK